MSPASPSGSYTLTLKWLKAHSQERIRCHGDNNIISFFDNNQVNKVLSSDSTSNRKWSKTCECNQSIFFAIGSDGLPYVLASIIIEEIFVCPVCRKQFDGITNFSTHISDTGHVDDPEDERKYKNILMLTGTYVESNKIYLYMYVCMYV